LDVGLGLSLSLTLSDIPLMQFTKNDVIAIIEITYGLAYASEN